MGMLINALRGMYICVRVYGAGVGMYNTLLQGNDPGLMVECLNGYRLKEKTAFQFTRLFGTVRYS